MKITEKLTRGRSISIEIIPPKRGDDCSAIFSMLDRFVNFQLLFVSVTKHLKREILVPYKNKFLTLKNTNRPGTVGLTQAIMTKYNIDVVPHIVIGNQSIEDVEDMLIDLAFCGIENIFIVRGDLADKEKKSTANHSFYYHSSEAVQRVRMLNKGKYISVKNGKPIDFCIGVAGYPEKHYEALNQYDDLLNLKKKVDAGADYIITQMVFDPVIFKKFVLKARKVGINVPIIPGIKPITNIKSLFSIPKNFFVTIPHSFTEKIMSAKTTEKQKNIGINYTIELIESLYDQGVPAVHLFTTNMGEDIYQIMKELSSIVSAKV
ncbi:MAG: methylenetetrahydrofolate reductase [Spirochaetes bacterium]|nr:methylenetetrahydrofolate reductase [Spirochaetota bacterium]